MTEVGQWVQDGGWVAEIISHGEIDALVDVPERLVNQVQPEQTIELIVEPLGERVPGRVFSITPAASTAARTFPIKIRFGDQEGKFKAGMSVLANVPTDQLRRVLLVPRDAVLRNSMGTRIWINSQGMAAVMPVRVLFGHQDRLAIEPMTQDAGLALQPGTQVVIEGAERLFPGQPLQVVADVPSARTE